MIKLCAVIVIALALAGCGTASLPTALSCSNNDYPGSFDKGQFAFADVYHVYSGANGGDPIVNMPLANRLLFGTSTFDKSDLVLTIKNSLNADGSTTILSGSLRVHPVSSEGNDHYKIDLSADGNKPTRMLCLGPIAQKQYAAAVAADPAQQPVAPHVKAGGFICDKDYEVMGNRQLRDGGASIAFQGCEQIGADTAVNVLADSQHFNAVQVGNAGGVAWVDPADLVR